MDRIWMERLTLLGHSLHKKFGSQVRIAGGAVRNAFTDRPIKDLDIFFNDEAMVPALCDFLNLTVLRDPLGCSSSGSAYADAGNFDGMKVWKCDKYIAGAWFHPVDLLFVPSIDERIRNFPDDISKFWIDGQYAVWRAIPEATKNVEDRCITYRGVLMREARLKRLKELYSEFEFIALDHSAITLTKATISRQDKRRAADPSYAPLWWDLPSAENQAFQTSCMDAVRDFCSPTRR